MPDKKPTLILVHGAWHGIETWDKVSLFLEGKQFKCIAVALPSTAGDASATFGEDVNAVREAILAETTQGNEVVLVLHSYGGVVGQSAIKGLDGVLGILLMTSFFAITGVSIIDASTLTRHINLPFSSIQKQAFHDHILVKLARGGDVS